MVGLSTDEAVEAVEEPFGQSAIALWVEPQGRRLSRGRCLSSCPPRRCSSRRPGGFARPWAHSSGMPAALARQICFEPSCDAGVAVEVVVAAGQELWPRVGRVRAAVCHCVILPVPLSATSAGYGMSSPTPTEGAKPGWLRACAPRARTGCSARPWVLSGECTAPNPAWNPAHRA